MLQVHVTPPLSGNEPPVIGTLLRAMSPWPVIAVMFGATCFGQVQGKLPCDDPKDVALKLAGRTDQSWVSERGTAGAEVGVGGRYCAGAGFTLLAEDLFNAGKLAEASRYASAAIGLLEAEPADARLLLGALRIQGTMYIERGLLSEALAVIERLNAMPVKSPEQNAIARGLSAACYHAGGDYRAAEREYLLAIHEWDSMQRSQASVSERSNLGVLYMASKRFDEAIIMLDRANALLGISGKNAAYYGLIITNNLALAYSARGATAPAVRYAREAVRLAETGDVGGHQVTANVYFNSAGVLRAAGRRKEADELERRGGRAESMANAVVDVSNLGASSHRSP